VWRWWHEGSVHLAPWPTIEELGVASESAAGSVYGPVCDVLEAIRREKSTAKASQRAPVSLVQVSGPTSLLEAVRAGQDDLAAAGTVSEWRLDESHDVTFAVTMS
jgi:valyl-tRNA synthetase